MNLEQKVEILAAGARYDASCASSGSAQGNRGRGVGSAVSSGICHSWSEDGRCISLLKVLYSNHCIYDCAYCHNRRSNDIPRASFTPEELVRLTMAFYRRNYIEGLFLSSAVSGHPDRTMEALYEVARLLREREGFHGYIHMKLIPGADPAWTSRIGYLVDRVSMNLELPSLASLALLAPEKRRLPLLPAMRGVAEQARSQLPAPRLRPFIPAGQSTQLIVGASPDSDRQILRLGEALYERLGLKRVYYSAYIALNADPRLPAVGSPAPLLREHRLYQADWLLRFYDFRADELLDVDEPMLDIDLDPKSAWACRHLAYFPVDVMTASREALLRVPGLGPVSCRRILAARRHGRIDERALRRMGVVMRRARYFLLSGGRPLVYHEGPGLLPPRPVLESLLAEQGPRVRAAREMRGQMSFFDDLPTAPVLPAAALPAAAEDERLITAVHEGHDPTP